MTLGERKMAVAKGSAKKQGDTLANGLKDAGFKGDPKPANVSMLAKAGTVTKSFMHDQANLDKQDAVTAALDNALGKTKTLSATIAKSIAHAQSTESDEMKIACLDEIADMSNSIRDKSRQAIRDAKKAQEAAKPKAKAKKEPAAK